MRDNNILESLLNFWQTKERHNSSSLCHFNDTELYKLALSGALEQAKDKDLCHLSSCSDCFSRWDNWRNSISFLDNQKSEQNFDFVCGFLEAAATNISKEPISSNSSCGRFKLTLYPQGTSENAFMITLETLTDKGETYEGNNFQVRDANNQILLDGQMQNRRLARIKKALHDPDLSQWTLTKTPSEKIS